MDESHGAVPEPDSSTVVDFPAPAPTISTSSSLLHALTAPPPKPPRTSPPPFYNPYPYEPQWKLDRTLAKHEQHFFHHREDYWMRDIRGFKIRHVKLRVVTVVINGVAERQARVRRALEEERLARPPPPAVGMAEMAGAVDFATADGQRGIPVKMLLASRRALESGMQNPKWKCFTDWHRDTEWVRIKWPAYPEHTAPRSILVTRRVNLRRPRRPVTRLELVVELAGVITQYYSEATALEPAPEYAHLALGPGEGRVSLYGLLMVGLRPAPDGVFDIVLELNSASADMKPRVVHRISAADLDALLPAESRPSSPAPLEVEAAGPSSAEGAGAAATPADAQMPVPKVERSATPTL
ncbi:hypothetical protein BC628DRAFT_540663 [Trametes gibbosa]|nr:hypothetical protein BC628DRAFT_540663 [Trametes gibbosa]